MKTKSEQIELAVNNYRDCLIIEHELSLKENSIKADKVKAHNDTLLAKQEVYALQQI